MPHFETTITGDGDLVLNNGGGVTGGHCRVEGGFYAGTAVDTNYDLDIKGKAKIQSISNATSDTNKFLVSDGGELKYRTGAEVLSDIGAGTGSGTVTSVGITAGTGISVSGSPITGSGSITVTNTAPATIDGSGAANRVAYWSDADTLTSDADLTFSGTNLTCGGVYFASTANKGAPSYSFTGDTNTGMYREAADTLAFAAGGSTYLQVSSSGVGVSSDIFHVGDTDTKIAFTTNVITVTTGGTEAFDVTSGSTRFSTQTRFTSGATFDDNSQATFGDSGDLAIYSDGTDGIITVSDDLKILAADDVNIQVQGGETAVSCIGNGKVSLYYNNTERWETLSDGAGTDGDIIETISNGGGKRIGFNVGDSFTHNSNTIAHYGISNAGNATDGGIVLSGYFGLKFATNGVIRATIQNDGDTALLSHTLVSGFDENNSSTSYYYIPLAGSITEGTSNQYYRTFACPQAGRVVSIMMMHTSGTAVSLNTYTTQLRVIKNGSTAATSSELSASNGNNDGSYIEYLPDVDFNKGDRLGFQFSKSSTIARWRGTSVTIMIELDDYNL